LSIEVLQRELTRPSSMTPGIASLSPTTQPDRGNISFSRAKPTAS
jgi:hypothetical protein